MKINLDGSHTSAYICDMSDKNEIAKQEFTAASFSDANIDLSVGQSNLMELLTGKIEKKEPITQDDIIDCYWKIASKDGEKVRVRWNMGWNVRNFHCEFVDRNSPIVKTRANSWFRANLGACIIKGKLLVIPVIEVDGQKQISQ